MKTEDLITLLSRETPAARRVLSGSDSVVRLVVAAALSALLLLAVVGWRPDLGTVLAEPRFLFKFVVAAALVGAGALACRRLMQPQIEARWGRLVLPLVVILVGGVGLEFLLGPAAGWRRAIPGTLSLQCLVLATACSVLPVAAALHTMSRGAPASPAAAGAAAGLLGGGVGIAVYALHCPVDSALFVAVWYMAAQGIVAAIASLVGRARLVW